MEFQEAVKAGFNNYANFSGRASRSEFWYWILFCFILNIVSGFIDTILGLPLTGLLIFFGLLVPNIAVGIRRLHDTDRSGWWYLLNFVPVIGWIILIIWCATKGTDGPNRFGNDPLLSIAA